MHDTCPCLQESWGPITPHTQSTKSFGPWAIIPHSVSMATFFIRASGLHATWQHSQSTSKAHATEPQNLQFAGAHLEETGPLGPGVGLGIKNEAAGFRKVGSRCAGAAEATNDMDPVSQCSCCEGGPGPGHVCQGLVVKVDNAVVGHCACEVPPAPVHASHQIDLDMATLQFSEKCQQTSPGRRSGLARQLPEDDFAL